MCYYKFSVRSTVHLLEVKETHASATPIMTGIKENIFAGLLDVPNIDEDNAIVKIGVKARTT